MLTMRYLLAYYSRTTSQWRCLDTRSLAQQIERPEDISAALEDAPMITLSWMLERRTFGRYRADEAGDGDASVIVYALASTTGSPFGDGTDYVGPWLEMFMQARKPLGLISLATEMPMAAQEGFTSLRERSADPMQASDPVCQQTMDRLREMAPPAGEHFEATREPRTQGKGVIGPMTGNWRFRANIIGAMVIGIQQEIPR